MGLKRKSRTTKWAANSLQNFCILFKYWFRLASFGRLTVPSLNANEAKCHNSSQSANGGAVASSTKQSQKIKSMFTIMNFRKNLEKV